MITVIAEIKTHAGAEHREAVPLLYTVFALKCLQKMAAMVTDR